jgi:hypothetical protein
MAAISVSAEISDEISADIFAKSLSVVHYSLNFTLL